MATSYDCKFIETSVGLNHNVDELLVGLLKQIRLKLENPERNRDLFRRRSRKNRSKSPLGSCSENNSPKKYRGSRTSASLKVRHLLDKVWARDSKSKSCENLHVLQKQRSSWRLKKVSQQNLLTVTRIRSRLCKEKTTTKINYSG